MYDLVFRLRGLGFRDTEPSCPGHVLARHVVETCRILAVAAFQTNLM